MLKKSLKLYFSEILTENLRDKRSDKKVSVALVIFLFISGINIIVPCFKSNNFGEYSSNSYKLSKCSIGIGIIASSSIKEEYSNLIFFQ